MFIGSFGGDFNQFQTDPVVAIIALRAAGVSQLLLNLTNNGGEIIRRDALEIMAVSLGIGSYGVHNGAGIPMYECPRLWIIIWDFTHCCQRSLRGYLCLSQFLRQYAAGSGVGDALG